MRQLLFTLTALGLLLASAAADQIIIEERDGKDIVTVRATEATQSKQALTKFTHGPQSCRDDLQHAGFSVSSANVI